MSNLDTPTPDPSDGLTFSAGPAPASPQMARLIREAIKSAPSATGDDAVFCDEVAARGQGPFDELPPWRRRRAARRVRRATGKRIRVLDPCLPGRLRSVPRARGAGTPRGRRVTRSANAPPGESDEGEPARGRHDDVDAAVIA